MVQEKMFNNGTLYSHFQEKEDNIVKMSILPSHDL